MPSLRGKAHHALLVAAALAAPWPVRAQSPAPSRSPGDSIATVLGGRPASPVDPDARRYRLRPIELRPASLAAVPTEPPERSLLLSWGEALGANLVIWSWNRSASGARRPSPR